MTLFQLDPSNHAAWTSTTSVDRPSPRANESDILRDLTMRRWAGDDGGFVARADPGRQECVDTRGDRLDVCLEREMTGIQELHVGVRIVARERERAGRQEERVVLPPDREDRRLVPAEILLNLRIERDVARVI